MNFIRTIIDFILPTVARIPIFVGTVYLAYIFVSWLYRKFWDVPNRDNGVKQKKLFFNLFLPMVIYSGMCFPLLLLEILVWLASGFSERLCLLSPLPPASLNCLPIVAMVGIAWIPFYLLYHLIYYICRRNKKQTYFSKKIFLWVILFYIIIASFVGIVILSNLLA